jgi:hypothetical protein
MLGSGMPPRWWPAGVAGGLLAGIAFGLAAHGQSPRAAGPSDLDPAIALLADARAGFASVRDYECRLVKRERVRGVLLPESVMALKVRTNPFSVYLRCDSPEADRGLEVCYVEGRNDGKMRVHPPHIMGVLGFWTVATNDPRAFEKNRHTVTEAGFAHLLDATARAWDWERRVGKTAVRITDDEIVGRSCTRIETIHPDWTVGPFYGYRCVLWLDKATRLPVGAETYDWPPASGPVGGELLEAYRFLDVRFNVGLGDNIFAH